MIQSIDYASRAASGNSSGILLGNSKPEANRHFEIRTLEWIQNNRPFLPGTPHRLDGFEIIWVKKGAVSLVVDFHGYELNDNTIYCLSPGQLRQLQVHTRLEGYYIYLSEEYLYLSENQTFFSFISPDYRGSRSVLMFRADKETKDEMEDIVKRMIKEFANYFPLRSEILKGLLRIFLIDLSRKLEVKRLETPQGKHINLVEKFRVSLKKHFTTKKMVVDYADELCVSSSYLNQIVKKATGFPASYHIQQYIVLEAKRQAIYSTLSMKEIADFLGFEDCSHFSKYFKKISGMNFTSFKKGYSENRLQF